MNSPTAAALFLSPPFAPFPEAWRPPDTEAIVARNIGAQNAGIKVSQNSDSGTTFMLWRSLLRKTPRFGEQKRRVLGWCYENFEAQPSAAVRQAPTQAYQGR